MFWNEPQKNNICTYYVNIVVILMNITTIYHMFIYALAQPPEPQVNPPPARQAAGGWETHRCYTSNRADILAVTVKMGWKPRTTRTWHMKRNHGRSEAWRFWLKILYLFWLFDVWCFWYHWLFPIYILKASLEIRCSLDSHRYKILVNRENRYTPED